MVTDFSISKLVSLVWNQNYKKEREYNYVLLTKDSKLESGQ